MSDIVASVIVIGITHESAVVRHAPQSGPSGWPSLHLVLVSVQLEAFMPSFRRSHLAYLATALLATSPANAAPPAGSALTDRQLASALQLILSDTHSDTAVCLYPTTKLPLPTHPSYQSAADLLAKQGGVELFQHPWTSRILNQAAEAAAKLLPKTALRLKRPGRGNGCRMGFWLDGIYAEGDRLLILSHVAFSGGDVQGSYLFNTSQDGMVLVVKSDEEIIVS